MVMRPLPLIAAAFILLSGSHALAQDSAAPPRSSEAVQVAPGTIEESKPPVYYVKDEKGKLVPVVGFSPDELEKLYRIKEGIAEAKSPPRYHIRMVNADGTVQGDTVRLSVSIEVVVHVEGWVRFPIRLRGAVLTEQPQAEEGTGFFVDWNEADSSHIGYVSSKPDDVVQLHLTGLLPLERAGDTTSFNLDMPHTVRSECTLTVPGADLTASASGTGVVTQKTTKDGTTQITLSGYRGPTVVSWRKKGTPRTRRQPVLECTGQVLSRLDENTALINAELSVQSLSVPFDRFRVRLPKGAEFIEADSPDQTISCEPVATDPKESPVLEVRLERETVGPVKVRLSAKQACDAQTRGANWFELSGFDVLDAVRQSGRIAVEVAGNRYLVRGPSHGVHQIDEVPKAIAREDVVAAFEYFSRPCSLTARVTTRNTRIGVEPDYRLFVEAEQIRLEATLRYTIRGTKTHSLEVDLPAGWKLDSVGPEGVVAVDGLEIDNEGLVSLPLVEPTEGRIEITLTAHLPIAADTTEIAVPIPNPAATYPAPASVAILPADNVELTPSTEKTTGLVLRQSAPPVRASNQQNQAFFYRTESGPRLFCAGFRVHGREIKLDIQTALHQTPHERLIRQKFAFDVAYEPLDRLTFRVPKAILDAGRARFYIAGEEMKVLPAEPAPDSTDFRLVLPEPRLGEFELETRYELPEDLTPNSSVERNVPLVWCPEAIPRSNRLEISSTEDIDAVVPGEVWKKDSTGSGAASADKTVYQATGPQAEVAVRFSRKEPDAAGSTVVDRAWIQTRLTHSVRQDRACFRFTTKRPEVELLLPQGAASNELRLRLDGAQAAWRVEDGRRLFVAIPPEPSDGDVGEFLGAADRRSNRSRLIEVEYRFTNARDRRGPMRFEFPRFGGGAWVRCAYWELVLPRDEDVILTPGSWVHEYRWAWRGVFHGRVPVMGQSELEEWVGAGPHDPLPSNTNRYLFSAVGITQQSELVTSARALTVLILSGIVLVAGLCFIYVPATRHPAVFLMLAVAGSAAAVIHPEAALLGLQAASIGFGLVLVALFLQRLFAGRRGVVVLEPSSSVLGSDSTKTQFPGAVVGADSSAQVSQPSSSARGSAL